MYQATIKRPSNHVRALGPRRRVTGEQGVACEDLPHRPNSGDDDGTPAGDQYNPGGPKGPVDNPKGVMPGSGAKKIPNTGGPPYLALGALSLLGAALIVGRGVLRR